MTELPPGWAKTALGALGAEIRGSQRPIPGNLYELYSVPTFATGRPEVVLGEEIGSNKRPVEPGDLLLCKINPRINRVWVVGDPRRDCYQVASPEYLVFRTGEARLSQYLMWYFRSPGFRDWIKLAVEGATGSHTRAKSGPILEQSVPLPPLAEQHRIVEAIEERFSRLDAAESLLNRAMLRTRAFRTSQVESIMSNPSWSVVPFSDIASIRSNLVDPAEFQDCPHIAPNHIISGTGQLLPVTTVASDGVTSPKHHFRAGQIVYSKIRPYLQKAVIATFDGLCSADMYPIETSLDRRFLLRFMLSPAFTRQAVKYQGRSVLPKINQHDLKKILVPAPSEADQLAAVAEIEQKLFLVEVVEVELARSIARCSQLRRSILQQAFSGRLVPQDPEDEPASILLERIKSETPTLATGGRGTSKKVAMQ